MYTSSRAGIGKMVVAVIVIVMVVIVIGVGTVLSSQGPPVTSTQTTSTTTTSPSTSSTSTSASSSSTPGCTFTVTSAFQATFTASASFTGCLTSGAQGTYLVASTDPDGLNLTGTITAQTPVDITIGSAKIGTLLTASGTLYSMTGVTSVSLPGIQLLPSNGYGITIKNLGTQNDTVTMSLQFTDIPPAQ